MGKNKNRNKPTIPIKVEPSTLGFDRRNVEEEREHFTNAMLLVNASVLPMALKTAIDTGILDVLAATPNTQLTVEEIGQLISARNSNAPGMLERILSLLSCFDVIFPSTEGTQTKYCLTPVGKYFARNEDGVSLAPFFALTLDKVFLESWSELKGAIIEGGTPFNRAHGAQLFEYPAKDPRFSQVYNTAMFNRSALVVKEMLKSYDGFKNLKQVVHVGGGIGVGLSLITSKYPAIKGINFDLPHVVRHAPPFPGVKHVEGDMFESIPKGDAIILLCILHDWDDEHCVKLLKNCYDALPHGGKIIVVEQILALFADLLDCMKDKQQVDVLSLAQTHGGKERNQNDFFALALAAGFGQIGIGAGAYDYRILEFHKNCRI